MSWSSCRSETETYSGRYIYDKESDRWKIDKWKLLLSKKFANSAINLFSMSEPPGIQRPGNIKEVDSIIHKFL